MSYLKRNALGIVDRPGLMARCIGTDALVRMHWYGCIGTDALSPGLCQDRFTTNCQLRYDLVKATVPRVFDRFDQADAARLGGTVAVESTAEVGTTFSVFLSAVAR